MNSRRILLFPIFIVLISIQAGCFYLTHAPTVGKLDAEVNMSTSPQVNQVSKSVEFGNWRSEV